MANNLNSKLTRVDEAIATMRQNLKISSNAPVEEVVNATNFALKDLMNIYIQENEPTEKDGIWLQTAPFDYDSVTIDERCHVKNTIDQKPGQHYASSSALAGFVQVGNYVYEAVDRQINKYDINTWAYEKIASLSASVSAFTITNNKMYITCVNLQHFYEVDLDTSEIVTLAQIPSNLTSTRTYCMGSVDNYVAIFGSSKGVIYNTITKEFTNMAAYPANSALVDSFNCHTLPNWCGNIITPGFGSNLYYASKICLFDPKTNTFSDQLPHASAYWPKPGSMTVIGNKLYILDIDNNARKLYEYDLKSQTVEQEFMNFAEYNCYYAKITNVNEQLVLFGGNYMNNEICLIAKDNSIYPDNTLVILQGKYK